MFTSLCRPTCAADSVYLLYTRCTLFTVNILFLSIAQLYVELNVNPDTCHSASTCSAFDSAEARVTYTLSYCSIRLSHLLKHFKLSLFQKSLSRSRGVGGAEGSCMRRATEVGGVLMVGIDQPERKANGYAHVRAEHSSATKDT